MPPSSLSSNDNLLGALLITGTFIGFSSKVFGVTTRETLAYLSIENMIQGETSAEIKDKKGNEVGPKPCVEMYMCARARVCVCVCLCLCLCLCL
jgi:hypothetical protein